MRRLILKGILVLKHLYHNNRFLFKKKKNLINHKKINTMNLIRINTTAFKEDDFLLLTTASYYEVIDVLEPLVQQYRADEEGYYKEDLTDALNEAYPEHSFELSDNEDLKTITI